MPFGPSLLHLGICFFLFFVCLGFPALRNLIPQLQNLLEKLVGVVFHLHLFEFRFDFISFWAISFLSLSASFTFLSLLLFLLLFLLLLLATFVFRCEAWLLHRAFSPCFLHLCICLVLLLVCLGFPALDNFISQFQNLFQKAVVIRFHFFDLFLQLV